MERKKKKGRRCKDSVLVGVCIYAWDKAFNFTLLVIQERERLVKPDLFTDMVICVGRLYSEAMTKDGQD